MDKHLEAIAEAFSRKALVYDEFGRGHENLERMRHKVRQHALSFLRPGDKILELNAGTGADAVFFGNLGYRVHATDLSSGMLNQVKAKIQENGLHEQVSVQLCSFVELENVTGGPYQYVFSNMGGVNCTNNLVAIRQGLPQLLQPGGYITWVVMPPICLWELAQALRGDRKTSRRRLEKGGVMATIEGVQFRTYYYSPKQFIQAMGNTFRPVRLEGLSVFTPPADHKGFSRAHPFIYGILRYFDELLSNCSPVNGWGDFFIVTFLYEP